MELCLGTVQFGVDYGIKELKKPLPEDALKCLDYATQNGIAAIDTAAAYGTAEEIVGAFLKKHTLPRENLFISTKLLPNRLDCVKPQDYVRVIHEDLKNSLKILHTDYIDAYLLHSARYAFCPEILDALAVVTKEGLAKYAGVSVYDPQEVFACAKYANVSFVQMPYSIFDHRMKEHGVFKYGIDGCCKIAIRSVFLQGLITLQKEKVTSYLEKAVPFLEKLDKFSKETGKSRIELAIGYVKRETGVSYLVFGVDSQEQLAEDIKIFENDLSEDLYIEMEKEFKGIQEDIVIPSLWKK